MSDVTNRLITTTQDVMLPKVVDTVLSDNVLAQRVLGAAKKWRGRKLSKVFKYQAGTSGSSFSGFDTFGTNASDRRRKLEFEPRFYRKTVTLPLTEVDINDGPDALVDLAAEELTEAAQEMADELGTIFYADGTGNSSKDFLGLQAIVDDGTNAATYGGQTRATYDVLDATYTDSSGTLSLAKMATLYSACKSGTQKPTIALTTEAIENLYEQLLQPMERIMQQVNPRKGVGMTGSAGFTALMFKGLPIISDEKCGSGILYFINENHLDFHAIRAKMNKPIEYDPSQIEGNNYDSRVKGLGFSWTGWLRPTNGYSLVGHIILGGNLVSFAPKRHGQLHSITGV